MLAFADEGCDVVLPTRRKDELERVAEMIRAKGRQAGPSIPPPNPP